jgi:hypothetical protein
MHGRPLWFYVLMESEYLADGDHLGPVGGRIVAEVLIGATAALCGRGGVGTDHAADDAHELRAKPFRLLYPASAKTAAAFASCCRLT